MNLMKRLFVNFKVCCVTLGMILQCGMVSSVYAVDPHTALEMLRSKKQFEERELVRLSKMVLIPGGKFFMGRDGVNEDEEPSRAIDVDAFYIDVYEVTQLQYLEAMKTNPSYFSKCLLCPVEKVTHDQAVSYCKQVGKRLPTEAEWEKAARGGGELDRYWGNKLIDPYAWYGNNSGRRTQPVGQREPNAFGLHDMAGNVWEWVQDWYDPTFYWRSPRKNPQGPMSGKERVIRGGGWGHPPEMLFHPVRDHKEPHTRYIQVGFRCARDADHE